jgi:hypothetical protein
MQDRRNYPKNPNILAKCVRERIPWADEKFASLNPTDVKTYYQELWEKSPSLQPLIASSSQEQ